MGTVYSIVRGYVEMNLEISENPAPNRGGPGAGQPASRGGKGGIRTFAEKAGKGPVLIKIKFGVGRKRGRQQGRVGLVIEQDEPA